MPQQSGLFATDYISDNCGVLQNSTIVITINQNISQLLNHIRPIKHRNMKYNNRVTRREVLYISGGLYHASLE